MRTLYKLDSKNKIRIWTIETNGDVIIQKSGLKDGKLVTHKKVSTPKNIGKSNETTGPEQALKELESIYIDKLNEGYFTTEDGALNTGVEFRPQKGLVWADQKNKPAFPLYGSQKMDGACAYFENGMLRSFTGETWVTCPHIIETLRDFSNKFPNIVLQGELYNHSHRENFQDLMSILRKQTPTESELETSRKVIEFRIHDMFDKDNVETKAFSRISFLETYRSLISTRKNVLICKQTLLNTQEEFDNYHKEVVEMGYEGTVVRPDVKYYPNKKTVGFFKRKDYQDAEFELVDFLEGNGNWSGKAKKALVKLDNGKICGVGVKATYEEATDYLVNKHKYIGKLATITFLKYTTDGFLREGILKDIDRPDL